MESSMAYLFKFPYCSDGRLRIISYFCGLQIYELAETLNKTRKHTFLLLLGIVFVAVNLRPTLSSVGPLIDFIKKDLGLSGAMLGLLTSLPLMAFAIVSTLTPIFTKKYGMARTILVAMGVLTFGTVLRVVTGVGGLYLGTLLIGIAIAFGNVLIPALTKQNFPEKAGAVTSLYSSIMAIGASVAAGVSVPLVTDFDLGWRGSLGVWAILSAVAFFVWIPQVKLLPRSKPRRSFADAMKNMSGNRLVWQLAFFMGLQSMTFYVILAWLPTILIDDGHDPTFSGWMLSLSQATGIIGSIVVPIWAGRSRDQRLIVVILVILEVIALIGLLFPQFGLVGIWVSLIGFVLGGTFGLALLLLVLRASDTDTSAELSGFAQSVGYLIAATGPFIAGLIFDLTADWNYAIVLLLAVSVGKMLFGIKVGKPGKV